jgi:hypothetical protein
MKNTQLNEARSGAKYYYRNSIWDQIIILKWVLPVNMAEAVFYQRKQFKMKKNKKKKKSREK